MHGIIFTGWMYTRPDSTLCMTNPQVSMKNNRIGTFGARERKKPIISNQPSVPPSALQEIDGHLPPTGCPAPDACAVKPNQFPVTRTGVLSCRQIFDESTTNSVGLAHG